MKGRLEHRLLVFYLTTLIGTASLSHPRTTCLGVLSQQRPKALVLSYHDGKHVSKQAFLVDFLKYSVIAVAN